MAVRICPLDGAKIESYPGVSLRVRAKEHYMIVHKSRLSPEEMKVWIGFYNSLPGNPDKEEIRDVIPSLFMPPEMEEFLENHSETENPDSSLNSGLSIEEEKELWERGIII